MLYIITLPQTRWLKVNTECGFLVWGQKEQDNTHKGFVYWWTLMKTAILQVFVWICLCLTSCFTLWSWAAPSHLKAGILSLPLHINLFTDNLQNQTSRLPRWTLFRPCGGQWALFSLPHSSSFCPFLSPCICFDPRGSLARLNVCPCTKGRWLICFNASICQLSRLSGCTVCEKKA